MNWENIYGDLSGGKFDITIASASDLWNFHDNADHSIPDAGQLAEAVTHINYKNIEVNGTTVTMSDPYAKIDRVVSPKAILQIR